MKKYNKSNGIKFSERKSKISIRKDNTRMKTESSGDEKNNISCDKQVTRILIPNEIDKIEENTNEIEFTNLDYNENKDSLEINPYFLGSNLNIDITKYRGNSEIEKKKVNKILNKPHKGISNNNINNISTSKNLRKTISIDNKLSSKMKRIRSMNLNNLEKPINTEKEISENKIRKKKNKFRTSPNNEIVKKNAKDKTSYKTLHNNKENKENKDNKVKPHRKKRENTVVNKSSEIKIKDYNIKAYKTSLFNKNSSSNMETKIEPNLIMKDEKEKINKGKKVIKYNGLSHKLLNFGFISFSFVS